LEQGLTPGVRWLGHPKWTMRLWRSRTTLDAELVDEEGDVT
jgi:hypothetical protein